jgi:hypothetical protein
MGGRRRLREIRISRKMKYLLKAIRSLLLITMLNMHQRYVMSLLLSILSNRVWDFKEGSLSI